MNYSKFILLGIIAFAGIGNGFVIGQNKIDRKRRISGGESICIEKVPHQVYLKDTGRYFCGGALIRPNIVLTAAHCVRDVILSNEQLPQLFVVAGTDSTKLENNEAKVTGSITIQAEDYKIHPKYDRNSDEAKLKYDFAVILLLDEFPKTERISPIEISTVDVKEDDELLLTGIGRVGEDSYHLSPCLKAYQTKVIDCEEALWDPEIDNYDGVICHPVENPLGHKPLPGDSGSPMVNSEGQLVGIYTGYYESAEHNMLSLPPNCSSETGINAVYHLDSIKQMIDYIDFKTMIKTVVPCCKNLCRKRCRIMSYQMKKNLVFT